VLASGKIKSNPSSEYEYIICLGIYGS